MLRKLTANSMTKLAINCLNQNGFMVWRANSGSVAKNVKLSPPGTPDIVGYGPNGRGVGIEVKIGRDKLRPAQIEWLGRASNKQVFTAVITCPEDLEEAILDFDIDKEVPW